MGVELTTFRTAAAVIVTRPTFLQIEPTDHDKLLFIQTRMKAEINWKNMSENSQNVIRLTFAVLLYNWTLVRRRVGC